MPKRINATLDEVNEAAAKLEGQITDSKDQVERSFKAQLEALEGKLRAEVQRVQVSVDRIDAVKIEQPCCDKVAEAAEQRLGELAAALRAEIQVVAPPILENIQTLNGALQEQIVRTDAEARGAFAQELESLCENFDQELTASKESIQAQLEERSAAADAALRKERGEMDGVFEAVRAAADASAAELKQLVADRLQEVVQAQEQTDKKQNAKAKTVQQDNEFKFKEVEGSIQKRAEEAAAAVAQSVAGMESALAKGKDELERSFQQRDAEIERLWHSFGDVENLPTRKIDWVIKHATLKLQAPAEDDEERSYTSWLSPKFDAAGARSMQLELRLHRPPSPEELEQPGASKGNGNVSVLLHAPDGTHIAFKLSIAKAHESFEHKFEGQQPCGSHRLCVFEEQVDVQMNTLTVGVEVMECIAESRRRLKQQQDDVDEEGNRRPWLEADFRLQRHVNYRVLDMVKTQLEYMKKRMTRRIEWRIEQASMMKRGFVRGAPMRSKVFDAAGVEGMQLHFYPSGYDTALEGYVSLFLSAPEGATLRCTLQVGHERKEVNHTFERAGLCGKNNFMRYEASFNPEDDFVMIGMDIHEAHVALVAKASHAPPVAAGLRSFAKEAQQLVPLGSTMKLTRSAEHLPDGLRDVMVLPSLWAAKNRFDAEVKILDGLRPLKDTRKGRPKSGGFGGRRSPSSPLLR